MSKNNSKILVAVKDAIERMLKRSQTKILFPVITLGIVKSFLQTSRDVFTDLEIRGIYQKTVQELKKYLGHDLHIGGVYYDAYSSRNLPQHKVIKVIGNRKYQLNPLYKDCARELSVWLPERIKVFIDDKLGIITKLAQHNERVKISFNPDEFVKIIKDHIDKNFSILKTLLINNVKEDIRKQCFSNGEIKKVKYRFLSEYVSKECRVGNEKEYNFCNKIIPILEKKHNIFISKLRKINNLFFLKRNIDFKLVDSTLRFFKI